jgi:hypothetical protein
MISRHWQSTMERQAAELARLRRRADIGDRIVGVFCAVVLLLWIVQALT